MVGQAPYAGRDAMYRSGGDLLAIAWIGSVVLIGGLALRWIGVFGAAGDASRFEAFASAVSGLSIVGFVYGAWQEHREFVRARGEPGARGG